MNLNKPMASSLWLSHILHISNTTINHDIKNAINIIKNQHILNKEAIKKNFFQTSYFYKKEHTCYLLSRTGCDYLITTLHLTTNDGIKLVRKLNTHFQHPENKLRNKYKKSINKLSKYTLSHAFTVLQSKQLGHPMSNKKGFYILKNLGCITNHGMPTAFMQQSGLYKILMGWVIKHRKMQHLQHIERDAHKYELKNMNYLQLLQQQLFSYAYDLKHYNKKFSSNTSKLFHILNTLGHNISHYNSLSSLLKNSNKYSLKLLLLAGYNMKKVGQQRIVSYQAHTLSHNFNMICKYYIKTMPTIDVGLDSINSIMHGRLNL